MGAIIAARLGTHQRLMASALISALDEVSARHRVGKPVAIAQATDEGARMVASSLLEPQDLVFFVIWLGPAIALAVWLTLSRRKSNRRDTESRRVA
jgi:hypothetical protein